MLGLNSQSSPVFIYLPRFSGDRAVHEISAIKLKCRFSCINFHNPSGGFFPEFCCKCKFICRIFIKHPVMIISKTEFQLFIFLGNILTYLLAFDKIKRSINNRSYLTCRNESTVNRCKIISIGLEVVVENSSIAFPF